ncbi:vp80 [Oxyplax ochracea nucleopolyhedrovirus]|uniref:Vp80 n=1 Tax=Oxyplax ochracea nucleopolyhedrovirus TaxID=2083176 RepID=A0A2L0WU05_9ABAC|nr:vp80 [Oxyplax ochracea nucleopolyhedrovirus]AVA31138.1 vp80 [Oxyplax ochracea nucleopolyhedrovirus]
MDVLDYNSLMISKLTSQILTKDLNGVDNIFADNTFSTNEKIDKLTNITKFVVQSISSQLKNEIFINNYDMRYLPIRIGIDFLKHFNNYPNLSIILDVIKKIDVILYMYETKNKLGVVEKEDLIVKAEQLYEKIEEVLRKDIEQFTNVNLNMNNKNLNEDTVMDIFDTTITENDNNNDNNDDDDDDNELIDYDNAVPNSINNNLIDYNNAVPSSTNNNNNNNNNDNYSTDSEYYLHKTTTDFYNDDDPEYKDAYFLSEYKPIVKTVLLRMIEKALMFLNINLHTTTKNQLKKFRDYLNTDKNDFEIFLNENDCNTKIKNLFLLANKFFQVYCLSNSLNELVNTLEDNSTLIQDENKRVKMIITKIINNVKNLNFKNFFSMLLSDYNNIKNETVKLLIDEYNKSYKITFVDDEKYESDDNSSIISSLNRENVSIRQKQTTPMPSYDDDENTFTDFKNTPLRIDREQTPIGRTKKYLFRNRNRQILSSPENSPTRSNNDNNIDNGNNSEDTLILNNNKNVTISRENTPLRKSKRFRYRNRSLPEEEEDELNDETDYEQKRTRRLAEEENFLKLKALELSKFIVNENLQKIIIVTDEMKRLYEYCNCKSSLETLPNALDYVNLIKRLNIYNLNHVEMKVNFYELLFPLTLYNNDVENDLFYKLINYIFVSSNYFQNCAKHFDDMRKSFNAYGPFRQIDSIIMFVIKFNFLCDLKNFVTFLNDKFSTRHVNFKIHELLAVKDKAVTLAYEKLQFNLFLKKDQMVYRNSKYLEKLIMLMNADFNII